MLALHLSEDNQLLHEFACQCAEDALALVARPDERSVAAIEAKRRWLRGEITDEELDSASAEAWHALDSAWAVARDAAYAAAWAASRDDALAVARDAAWAAAEAARDNACAAALAVTRDAAALAAARDAAWDAAMDKAAAVLAAFPARHGITETGDAEVCAALEAAGARIEE